MKQNVSDLICELATQRTEILRSVNWINDLKRDIDMYTKKLISAEETLKNEEQVMSELLIKLQDAMKGEA